jgi:hypothetical protein
MAQLKVIVCTLAVVCVYAQAREAQAQARGFSLGGGFVTQLRQVPGAPSLESPPDQLFPGVRVGAGIELRPGLSLDASISWFRANTFEWPFTYLSLCCSIKRTTERDMPLAVVLRHELECGGAWCVSVLGGGGVNLHRIRLESKPCSHTLSQCGSDFRPESSGIDAQPLVTFGLELTVKATAKVQFGPSVAVILVKRPEYLTGYFHRGPENVSGYTLTVGASVIWTSRAR